MSSRIVNICELRVVFAFWVTITYNALRDNMAGTDKIGRYRKSFPLHVTITVGGDVHGLVKVYASRHNMSMKDAAEKLIGIGLLIEDWGTPTPPTDKK